MTPAKRNEGIQYRERQTKWERGHLALSGEDVHNDSLIREVDTLISAGMITVMEAQLARIMGE